MKKYYATTHYALEIMPEPRYYTVKEANDLLPQLTRVLVQMQAQARQHGMVQSRIGDVTKTVKSNGHHDPIEDPMVSQVSRARAKPSGMASTSLPIGVSS